MPSFCRLELPLLTLWPYKDNKCVNEILFKTKFDNVLYWGFCIALLCLVFAN